MKTLKRISITALLVFMGVISVAGYMYFHRSPDSANVAAKTMSQVVNSVYEACSQEEQYESCYASQMEQVAIEHGHEYAFEVLFTLQDMDPRSRGCHFIAHGIGHGVYERNPETWRKDLAEVSQTCTYGAPMGIIEEYFFTLPAGMVTKEFVPTICGDPAHGDCNHVVGHVLLADPLVRGDLGKALDLCTSLPSNEKHRCDTGVFMEHMTALNLIEHGYAPESYLNWPSRFSELEELCRSYGGEHGEACWKELTHVAAVTFKNDPKQLFDFCNTAPAKNERMECIDHGIGIIAGAENFDIASLVHMCKIQQPEFFNFEIKCHSDLVDSVFLSTPRNALEQAVQLCSSVPENHKMACFYRIGIALELNEHQYTDSDVHRLCLNASPKHLEYCTGERSIIIDHKHTNETPNSKEHNKADIKIKTP